MSPRQYTYHTFLSYTTREDEVRQIKPFIDDYTGELRRRIARLVFYDGWCLPTLDYPPDQLRNELRTAISESAFTTAFISPGYAESYWCQFEWDRTLDDHATRSNPSPLLTLLGWKAGDFSILPILWKGLDLQTEFMRANHRMTFLDISEDLQRGLAGYRDALEKAVEATLRFVRAWDAYLPNEQV